jgi:hypothetical protein
MFSKLSPLINFEKFTLDLSEKNLLDCNGWKVYTRPTSAFNFYFHQIWNILKVLVSHQKFLNFVLLKSCFLPIKSHKT